MNTSWKLSIRKKTKQIKKEKAVSSGNHGLLENSKIYFEGFPGDEKPPWLSLGLFPASPVWLTVGKIPIIVALYPQYIVIYIHDYVPIWFMMLHYVTI